MTKVTNELYLGEPVRRTTVRNEPYTPLKVPCPSKEEYNQCPAQFRCIVCQRKRSRKKWFGGLVAGQYVCRGCYPFVDEQDVVQMARKHEQRVAIRFDQTSEVADVWSGVKQKDLVDDRDIRIVVKRTS